jgi:hypothetical protein
MWCFPKYANLDKVDDFSTQEIISAQLTGNDKDDAFAGIGMLQGQIAHIQSFHVDGHMTNLASGRFWAHMQNKLFRRLKMQRYKNYLI